MVDSVCKATFFFFLTRNSKRGSQRCNLHGTNHARVRSTIRVTGQQPLGHSRVGSHPAHTCTTCSISFSNNYQLEQHATKSKHKAYLCACGKAFTKLSALRRHFEESTQTRQHRCPHALCDNEFKRPGHVEQHLRLIHRMTKDAIKDILNAQKSEPCQDSQEARAVSATAPMTVALNAQAGNPGVNPGGSWGVPIDFSVTVGQPDSRPGYYPAFSSGFPVPVTGPVTGFRAFSAQKLMTQAPGFPAYPAFQAGAAADQTGLPAIPAPEIIGYPAAYPNLDLGLFNADPAFDSLSPADGFGMPALETEFMGELFDFDFNTFGS